MNKKLELFVVDTGIVLVVAATAFFVGWCYNGMAKQRQISECQSYHSLQYCAENWDK